MQLRGTVVKRPYATGSKSARPAVMLDTGDVRYVLRRVGGNAFADSVLDGLVGSSIECEGTVHGSTLILSSWRRLPA